MKIPFGIRYNALVGNLAISWSLVLLCQQAGQAQTADGFNPAPNAAVLALAMQADGKVLVGGDFVTIGGQSRTGLARLNADGTADTGFNPRPNSTVWCLAVQLDGKVLVGGDFTALNGQTHNYLARLNPDGSADTTFTAGADSTVYALALQADGKILVGGVFTNLAGQVRSGLGRLNSDGTLDVPFNPNAGNLVRCLAVQPDGGIVVGGGFTALNGQPATYLGRLLVDGTLDNAFMPDISGPVPQVSALLLQPDGSVVIGGSFTTVNGQPRNSLARLGGDAALDANFVPDTDNVVTCLALQTDGSIVVGGLFNQLGGQACANLGRLASDGSPDLAFNPGANDEVVALAVQADGRVLAGGFFGQLAGTTRSRLGRLNNGAATQSLSLANGTATWLRGGTSPEVWLTTFDGSLDGINWSALGAGGRIQGGWAISGVQVATNYPLRARGYVAGFGLSTWLVETVLGSGPNIGTQPASRTNNAGTTASFNVGAAGSATLAYQWRKGGTNLTDGGKVAGTHTLTLTLSNVLAADAGLYSVTVSNLIGSVTSLVATLTVVDPAIITSPPGRTNNAGTVASFTVTAAGTPALGYQWRKGGTNLSDGGKISGARSSALSLTNVLGADAGGYSVVVTNSRGGITSVVANLSVVDPLISIQPVSLLLDAGQTALFTVTAAGTTNLTYQWRKNGSNLIAATTTALVLANAGRGDIAGYDVVVTNLLGRATSGLAMLSVNLATVDAFAGGASGPVHALALQKDNRVLLGGAFTALGGQSRNCLGRLNDDGTLDPSFDPSPNGQVNCLAVQTNGAILVGGSFSTLAHQPRNNLGRLDANGSVDAAFDPGADGNVITVALQADGKILVGGAFSTLAGQTRHNLGRLNADGSLDATFNPDPDNAVVSLAVQPDGKILAGGLFTDLGGFIRYFIGRLNVDGSLDTNFNANADSWVESLIAQPDGKILVAGVFTALGGQPRKCVGRLNADGLLDAAFNPNANELVYAVALQADGRILLGGNFTSLGGQLRSHLARLNSDGTLDPTFSAGASDIVYCLAVQTNGATLAGGRFATLDSQARSGVARLNATDPATDALSFDGMTITWSRGGSAPEIWAATFDAFTNGPAWVSLGAAARITNGWQLTGLSLPPGALVRARGLVASGGLSSWFVERTLPAVSSFPPAILEQDGNFGFRAGQFGFSVLGDVGQVVGVEASLNLVDWFALTNLTLDASPVYISDPGSTNSSPRFYRARLQ